MTASVEYAVAALGVEDIVICGHSDCGAMTAIATCQCLDHLPTVAGWLRYADSAKAVNQAYPHASDEARVASMVRENVIAQLNNIKTHPSVALALDQAAWRCTAGSMTSPAALSRRWTAKPAASCRSLPIPR